jgi:hypothetical protein
VLGLGGFCFGVSSMSRAAMLSVSGRITYRTELPRMARESSFTGLRPRIFNLTRLRCVFIDTSTPAGQVARSARFVDAGTCSPFTVPSTTVPFFSSMVTVSLFNFIRNLRSVVRTHRGRAFVCPTHRTSFMVKRCVRETKTVGTRRKDLTPWGRGQASPGRDVALFGRQGRSSFNLVFVKSIQLIENN